MNYMFSMLPSIPEHPIIDLLQPSNDYVIRVGLDSFLSIFYEWARYADS